MVLGGPHPQQGTNQTAGHLGHRRVQVVHDHQHDGRCLTSPARVLINGVGPEVTEVTVMALINSFLFCRPGRGKYVATFDLCYFVGLNPVRFSYLMANVGQKRYM